VKEAIALGRRIAVVEGEKDADNLWAIGIPATCSAHGASEPDKAPKWTKKHSEQLRGADIVVFNDNDPAGYAHAEATSRLSVGVAERVCRLDLAPHWRNMRKGADVSDWLGAGHTREQLDALMAQAPEWMQRDETGSPILRAKDWLTRDLPEPDPIMGHWLTTTSRVLLTAPTGIGKTMFGIALSAASAAGKPFLRWQDRRPCNVLYIDGEMSRRLMKRRLTEEVERSGLRPGGLYILSHEDIEDFQPLSTQTGRNQIEAIIARIGKVDLAVFDNVMSLIGGDMKDEESWRQTLPWLKTLTKRSIGQIWVHHTGHDETRPYGTKTREWQMDTTIFLEPVERADTDVSFKLSFRKARERTPENRADFADLLVALVDDAWTYSSPQAAPPSKKPSPAGQKFWEAFLNCPTIAHEGRPCISEAAWWRECERLGLIDPEGHSARSLFSKHRRELVTCNKIACNGEFSWKI
jgi:hypothetical protein